MALKKGNETKPAFEDDGGSAPATQVADKPTQDAAAAASVAGVTAVAAAAASSSRALAPVGKFKDVYTTLENALPPLDFGTLVRVVGAQGAIEAKLAGGKTADLGKKIGLQLISFRSQWTISPGDDSADAKEFVSYSNDGVTIDSPDSRSGKNVAEYLDFLKTSEGYDKAASKRYVYLTGILTSQNGSGEEFVGQVLEVSLSPQGVQAFDNFRFQRSAQIAMGKASTDGAENVIVEADKRSGNGKNWTVLVVKAA